MTPTTDGLLAEQLSDLSDLPEIVLTKDRQELSTQGDIWSLRANRDGGGLVEVDYRPLRKLCSDRFILIVKLFVAKKAATSVAWSLRNIVQAVARSVRCWRTGSRTGSVNWSELRISDFQAVLSSGLKSPQGVGGNDFAHLRAIYAWGAHVARLTDFDPALSLQLKGMKAPGNLKGRKVLGSDPKEGAFTPEEVELLDQALKRGAGDPRAVIIAQLFQELGLRPTQVLRTWWSGLRRFEANVVESGETRTLVRYVLSIPRAKERGEHRVEEDRPISTLLGERLDKLKPSMYDETTPLCWWLDPDTSSKDLGCLLQGWVDEVGIVSPRMNRPGFCRQSSAV